MSFGASISCVHFQRFSNGLRHIVDMMTGTQHQITNFLDDFLFYAPSASSCDRLVRIFLNICNQIGFPVSMERTEWATSRIMFLGILLDGKNHRLCLPIDKRVKALNMVQNIKGKKKATVKELQILCGVLNFLNKAIVLGHPFTRRMYAKYSKKSLRTRNGTALKQYHHVNLDVEFRNDCRVWEIFLQNPMVVN